MANSFHNTRTMRHHLRSVLSIGALALTFGLGSTATAAGPATKISLDPVSVTLTADQTQTFKVIATAADNTTSDVTSGSTLSINDPLGSMTVATYQAGKAGTWTIQASYQSFTATATVTVTPGAVKEVVVNPDSAPEQTYLGKNATFTATVYDGKNNVISGKTATWSVVGDIGTINAQGVFTPKSIGTGKVQASVDGVIGEVSVVTNAALPTNTNVNTNTVANANRNANTNTAVNTNTTNANTNTAPVTTDTTSSDDCTTMKPWLWTLLLIVFLAAVAVLFFFVPIAKIWPAIVALLAAGILAYIQRQYACGLQSWWAWVVTIGTVALTAFALQMRPKHTPSAS